MACPAALVWDPCGSGYLRPVSLEENGWGDNTIGEARLGHEGSAVDPELWLINNEANEAQGVDALLGLIITYVDDLFYLRARYHQGDPRVDRS